MSPFQILTTLNALGAENGIGRADVVENRRVGMKSRGVYETPGGTILYTALRELEMLTLDTDCLHFKQNVAQTYADLVYGGKWFTPLRESLEAFMEKVSEFTTGTVRLVLVQGKHRHCGAQVPVLAVPEGPCLIRRNQLRPRGCHGLHQPLRASRHGGRPWCTERNSEVSTRPASGQRHAAPPAALFADTSGHFGTANRVEQPEKKLACRYKTG